MSTDKKPEKTFASGTKIEGNVVDKENGVYEDFRKALKTEIKKSVDMTNILLASLQESTESIRKPISTTATTAFQKGKLLGNRTANFYAKRREYGSEIIVGATLLGGIVGLRRGRIPAATIGSLSGLSAYLGVYQVDMNGILRRIFDQK